MESARNFSGRLVRHCQAPRSFGSWGFLGIAREAVRPSVRGATVGGSLWSWKSDDGRHPGGRLDVRCPRGRSNESSSGGDGGQRCNYLKASERVSLPRPVSHEGR